jgi:cytochrome c-type biogenesis protein CcmF
MYLFGTILVISGIAAALCAGISYILVTRGNTNALAYGRLGTRAAGIACLLVVLLLTSLFVAQRYDIEYVYDYSSMDLEFGYRVAAMWAGQPGSFVVWAFWGLLAAQFLVGRTRHYEPYVLSVFMLLQAGLLFFMLIRNPFVPFVDPSTGLAATPSDGAGLNELLHNPWMIIHPPILFVGYALLAIPFAFAIGGLWRRDYDGWMHQALPWTVAGWSFLGLALLLGGYWAYETLGWGGYWAWDPVENSAMVPWLTSTALIHGLLTQRAHGGMRRTNFALAVITYILVFYATFLTRSGVLSSFSVHSFVAEGLKIILIASLCICVVVGIAALAIRWRDIPIRPLSEKLLSRDSFMVLMIIGLLVIATVVSIGTSMPVISAIPGIGHSLQNLFGAAFEIDDGTTYGTQAFSDGRFGLVGSFYSTTVPPLGLIIVVLMIIGPLLGWRDTNPRRLLYTVRWPAIAAVLMACLALFLDARDLLSLGYISLGTFALGTNIIMIVNTLKGGWMRIGGYLSHVGLAIMLVGFVGSSGYATEDMRVVIPEGETVQAYGYDLTFNGYSVRQEDNKGLLDITVVKDDKDVFFAEPLIYFNDRMGATVATPSIKRELLQDFYISPAEYMPQQDQNAGDFTVNSDRQIGPYTLTFMGFDVAQAHAGEAEVGAQMRVLYEGKESFVTPKIRVVVDTENPDEAFQDMPATLPGGHTLSLVNFDPTQRLIYARVNDLGLPVDPAKAVITVSVKPAINLVWSGVIISVIGGLIAMVRRWREGSLNPKKRRAPTPQSMGEMEGALSGD